jgi:ATP-dependent DNA ligase
MSPALAVQGRGRQLFDLMLDHDLEGIVAKKLSDPYRPGTKWLKIKDRITPRKKDAGSCSIKNRPGRYRPIKETLCGVLSTMTVNTWCPTMLSPKLI